MYGTPLTPIRGENPDKKAKLWHSRLARGISKRQAEVPMWIKCEQFADGLHWAGTEGRGNQVTVNKIASHIATRQAATLFKQPRAIMRPVRSEDYRAQDIIVIDQATGMPAQRSVPRYRVCENLLNFVTAQEDFHLTHTVRLADRSCRTTSLGVVMCGYYADFETVDPPRGVDEIPVDPHTGLPDLSGLALDDNGQLVLDDEGRPIPIVTPTSEKWFCEWVPTRRMIFDPDGDNCFSSHSWVAMEVVRPLREVKKDKRFRGTRDLQATGTYDDEGRLIYLRETGIPIDDEVSRDAEMVRLFWVWDIIERRTLVLADGHARVLYDEETPSSVGDHPFVFLRYTDRTSSGESMSGGSWYSRPECADLVPLNSYFNELATQYLAAARRSGRKAIYRQGDLGPEDLDQLSGPDDGVYVGVDAQKNPNAPLADLIHQVEFGPVNADLLNGLRVVDQMFLEVAGQPRGTRTSDTATEASIDEGRAQMREDDQRNLLAGFYRGIYKKVYDSIQGNMETEIAVAIEGDDGNLHQAITSREMIQGDLDVSVDVQEMMPRNQQTEKAQMIEALTMWAQFPQMFLKRPVADAVFGALGIRNGAFIDALVETSMEVAAAQAPPAGAIPGQIGPGDGAGVPQDVAQMLAQQGGAMGPLMRGAR